MPARADTFSARANLWRLSLSLLVVFFHLSGVSPPQLGAVAVVGFFCTSGFLVTLITNEVYAGRPWAYLANRALRIYPIYWACLAFALLLALLLPGVARWNSGMTVPHHIGEALAQVFIFGLDVSHTRLLPTAWSLAIELYFYLVIGLVTARMKSATVMLTLAATVLTVLCALHLVPWNFYASAAGNADAFFMGSLVWHLRSSRRVYPTMFPAALAVFVLLAFGPPLWRVTVNIFVAAPSAGLVIWTMRRNRQPVGYATARFSDLLGRLTYPLFLIHSPVAALIGETQGLSPGWDLLAESLLVSLVFSLAVVTLVERPVERWRKRIRAHKLAMPVTGPP